MVGTNIYWAGCGGEENKRTEVMVSSNRVGGCGWRWNDTKKKKKKETTVNS